MLEARRYADRIIELLARIAGLLEELVRERKEQGGRGER